MNLILENLFTLMLFLCKLAAVKYLSSVLMKVSLVNLIKLKKKKKKEISE